MNKFKISTILLKKLRPQMFNEKWTKAYSILNELKLKSAKSRESKEKHFSYLVDEIYKDLENDNTE